MLSDEDIKQALYDGGGSLSLEDLAQEIEDRANEKPYAQQLLQHLQSMNGVYVSAGVVHLGDRPAEAECIPPAPSSHNQQLPVIQPSVKMVTVVDDELLPPDPIQPIPHQVMLRLHSENNVYLKKKIVYFRMLFSNAFHFSSHFI